MDIFELLVNNDFFWLSILVVIFALIYKLIALIMMPFEPFYKKLVEYENKKQWRKDGEPKLYFDPSEGTLSPVGIKYQGGNASFETNELSVFLSGDGSGKVNSTLWMKGKAPKNRTTYFRNNLLTNNFLQELFYYALDESISSEWNLREEEKISTIVSEIEDIGSKDDNINVITISILICKIAINRRREEIRSQLEEMWTKSGGRGEIDPDWLDKQRHTSGSSGMTLEEEDKLLYIDIRCHNSTWIQGLAYRNMMKQVLENNEEVLEAVGGNWTKNPWKLKGVEENIPYHLAWPQTVGTRRGESFVKILHAVEVEEMPPELVLRALLFLRIDNNNETIRIRNQLMRTLDEININSQTLRELLIEHACQHWRTLELATHALMQVAYSYELPLPVIGEFRRPLNIKSGNSADVKSGDIGDIQFPHETYIDERGKKFIEYAIDCKLFFDENNVSADLIDVVNRWSHEEVPQNQLSVFEWIGPETPTLDDTNKTQRAREFLENNGVTLRFSTLHTLADDLGLENNHVHIWINRYAQILCKSQEMRDEYGAEILNTSAWVNSLIASLSNNSTEEE